MGYCFNEMHLHFINLRTNLVYNFVFTLQEIRGLFHTCVWACMTSYFVGFDVGIKSLSRFFNSLVSASAYRL